MAAAFTCLPLSNHAFTSYEPGSEERTKLIQALDEVKQAAPFEVHPYVNGQDVPGALSESQESPFDHGMSICKYSASSPELIKEAIAGAMIAKDSWTKTLLHDRAAVFYRAASLIEGPYKYQMMAATMIGQGKNAYQADIDCVAESIDFLRMYPALAEPLYKAQPPFNAPGVWNRSETRPLDGFVYAISPFNFTALAVNLVLAPLIVGNVVIWKPSPGAIYSSWLVMKILTEAGLPKGVLQFVPGDAELITSAVFENADMSCLHFTGSTSVLRGLLRTIGSKMDFWNSFPRVVGETGGKNYHLIHSSAPIENAALKTVRAAFEYQGQKCSALSRLYLARSAADDFISVLMKQTEDLTMGEAFTDFIGPVISRMAFDRVSRFIDDARSSSDTQILVGGQCDDSKGYYIRPTIVITTDPKSKFMTEEIFGPFLCIYVYEDSEFGPRLFKLIEETSKYALTGAIFAADRSAIIEASEALKFSAGNFYINDQCTGAMPGHQPFGGSKASGTNDKCGTSTMLTRFVSWRTIKENFGKIDSVLYPSNYE